MCEREKTERIRLIKVDCCCCCWCCHLDEFVFFSVHLAKNLREFKISCTLIWLALLLCCSVVAPSVVGLIASAGFECWGINESHLSCCTSSSLSSEWTSSNTTWWQISDCLSNCMISDEKKKKKKFDLLAETCFFFQLLLLLLFMGALLIDLLPIKCRCCCCCCCSLTKSLATNQFADEREKNTPRT